jgi:hypothetical protein
MNKLTFSTLLLIMLFTTGCATNGVLTGDSYTDEGATTPAVEGNTSNDSNLTDPSAALPDIAAYDEPEIPALDTTSDDDSNSVEGELPEIAAYDDPEIPDIDAPAVEDAPAAE